MSNLFAFRKLSEYKSDMETMKKKRFGITLSEETYAALSEIRDKTGLPIATMVKRAITEYFEKHKSLESRKG